MKTDYSQWQYFIFNPSKELKQFFRANKDSSEELTAGDWFYSDMGNIYQFLGIISNGGAWIHVSEDVFFKSYENYSSGLNLIL